MQKIPDWTLAIAAAAWRSRLWGGIYTVIVDFLQGGEWDVSDGYYVAYKPITLSCILFMFIEMKFIHCHSCVMFAMKSMSICND